MRHFSSLDLTEVGFFLWLQSHYGNVVRASYRTIAKQVGGITYGAVTLWLSALEQKGLLTIENKGSKKQTYHLNGNEFERFMNE